MESEKKSNFAKITKFLHANEAHVWKKQKQAFEMMPFSSKYLNWTVSYKRLKFGEVKNRTVAKFCHCCQFH